MNVPPNIKVGKVEANLGNFPFVLKEINRMKKDGTLFKDIRRGKDGTLSKNVMICSKATQQKLLDRLKNLPDKPDCTGWGYLKNAGKAGLKALGIDAKIKKQVINQIAKTHGGKAAWALAAVMYSQDELLNKSIKDVIRQTLPAAFAKIAFQFEILKDASHLIEGVREAYFDHERHCSIYYASINQLKIAHEQVIGTIQFVPDVPSPKPGVQGTHNKSSNNNPQPSNSATQKAKENRRHSTKQSQNDSSKNEKTTPLKSTQKPPPAESIPDNDELEINVEELVDQFIDMAADLLGVKPAYQQVKDLKNMFMTIFANPKNAPKLIVDQLLHEPEQIFKRVIESPDEFIKNGEGFLKDPTLMNAANVVGTVYSMVSLANEILPMVTKLGRIASKNPGKAVLKIPEELGKLAVQKIIGVYKLGEALAHNPVKAIKNLGKGLIKQPEQLVKNVRDLFGHDKRKRKRRAKKIAAMQAEIERQIQAENERIHQGIIQFFPLCYTAASKNWMKSETMKPQAYFQAMFKDWQNSHSKGGFAGDFVQFLLEIKKKLQKGHFSQVHRLSPTAHLKEMTVPSTIAIIFAQVTRTTLIEACNGITIQRLSNEIRLISKQTSSEINQLSQTNTKLSQTNKELAALTKGKNEDQLAEELAIGLADPEKREAARREAARRALLGQSKGKK